jgi:tetratricopeptide (TPR) repeat protein
VRKEHAPKAPRKKDDIDFEIGFYESILKDTPNFIEALSAIGDLYTKAGYWQKGLDVDIKLTKLRSDDPIVHYNLACSYALLNQTRPSLNALLKAIEYGYDDFEYLKADTDLENLLKDEHVQAFIKDLEKKQKKKSSKL